VAFRTTAKVWFSGLALMAFAVSAKADLVTNGSFENNAGTGQLNDTTTAVDWTSAPSGGVAGYNFLFGPGTADTTGAVGSQYGDLKLWGPNDGSNNGLPASSPDGGYFVAADSDFESATISQTINGLTVGQQYMVGFWWAGAQQAGFTGVSTDQWIVSLGSQTHSTAIYTNPSEGFSGWMYQTFNYTATSSSETLSFLASGAPQVPPFSLLDGVSLNPTPEPGYVIPGLLMMALMGGMAIIRSRRRVKN
jgi:hypothetical protein